MDGPGECGGDVVADVGECTHEIDHSEVFGVRIDAGVSELFEDGEDDLLLEGGKVGGGEFLMEGEGEVVKGSSMWGANVLSGLFGGQVAAIEDGVEFFEEVDPVGGGVLEEILCSEVVSVLDEGAV